MSQKVSIPTRKIFLSHSGKDKEQVMEIAKNIKSFLRLPSSSFEIILFNTSDKQYRFKELIDMVHLGEDFGEAAAAWKNELIEYLKKNLLGSDVYLLLVTNRDLLENSEWILFEMEIAYDEALQRGSPFFIPCIYNGTLYSQLPQKAAEFQGVDLNSDVGFIKLSRELHNLFNKDR